MFVAESEGFEPPETRASTVFKTAAIDHSANFPKSGRPKGSRKGCKDNTKKRDTT